MSYASDLNPADVTEPIRGETMIKNRTGGYGYQITDLQRLDRFLILGHEGGTYYATSKSLSYETVDCIDRLLASDPTGTAVVDRVVSVSDSNRAPKNDPSIFALAYVASKTGTPASQYALSNLSKVCRTGTHLFQFLQFSKELGRGWGTAFKRAVANWYLQQDARSLAYGVTKYAKRGGWSHRDVLRLAHPSAVGTDHERVFKYVAQHDKWSLGVGTSWNPCQAEDYLGVVDDIRYGTMPLAQMTYLIREHRVPREVIPTEYLDRPEVWEALLDSMPFTALLRNLGKMGSLGMLTPLSSTAKIIEEKLGNTESESAKRVHPVAIYIAQKVYGSGGGILGKLTWTPNKQILSALEDRFFKAFNFVEPTGKNFLLGVDVSGSMICASSTPIISCREAAALMAFVTMKTEPNCHIVAFSHTIQEMDLTNRSSVSSVEKSLRGLHFGMTNIEASIRYAIDNNIPADVVCIYTDMEQNLGQHPSLAMEDLRRTRPVAKLAVMAFANTNLSIARPNDFGMMDFVGFDASTPAVLNDFVRN